MILPPLVFPGASHAALHSRAERLGVEGGAAAECDVVVSHILTCFETHEH